MNRLGIPAVLFSLGLTACGGGGSTSTPATLATAAPVATAAPIATKTPISLPTTPPATVISTPPPVVLATPTPTATPISYANTTSAYYLPLEAGNTWSFNSGSKLNDIGQSHLTCTSCGLNNLPVEDINVIGTTGAYAGTFYFDKVTSGQTGGVLAELVGVSYNNGVLVTLVTNGLGTYGIPVMDDRAFVGESWSYTGEESSTITAVGQTQVYAGPYVFIKNINMNAYTGALNVNWGFGQGVGFTSLAMNGSTVTLTSFSINAVNSQSLQRRTLAVDPANSADAAQSLALLKALF